MINLFFVVFIIIGSFFSYQLFTDKFPPEQRGIAMQEAVTPVMHQLNDFHNILLIMCFAISIFVVVLLAYTMVKFRRKNNPIPSKTTHNALIEIIWTVVPVIILVALAIPSIRLLYFMDKTVDAEMTLKIVGYQWYWGYEYPDHDGLSFDSMMIADDELQEGQKRLLETDNPVVIPINTNIRIQLTSSDVIHAWAVPQFGVKTDAVPGRLNETWMNVEKPGTYYGQCSELCGVNHGFMPIVVKAVEKEEFKAWVEKAKEEF